MSRDALRHDDKHVARRPSIGAPSRRRLLRAPGRDLQPYRYLLGTVDSEQQALAAFIFSVLDTKRMFVELYRDDPKDGANMIANEERLLAKCAADHPAAFAAASNRFKNGNQWYPTARKPE